MKIGDMVVYIGENNDITTLKTGDTGEIIFDYEDTYFEVEFLNEEGIVKVLEVINKEFLEKVKTKL